MCVASHRVASLRFPSPRVASLPFPSRLVCAQVCSLTIVRLPMQAPSRMCICCPSSWVGSCPRLRARRAPAHGPDVCRPTRG